MQSKKVALINDLSGFGRCSLGVALPILSALGHQCCSLPTAVLSNHTGYESYTFTDLTDQMVAYYTEWKKRGLKFAGIYSGFLGSEAQIDIVSGFLKEFGSSAIKLIDPVMGDGGRAYATFTPAMQTAMKRLICHADIITPNVTELMILLGRPYPKSISKAELTALADELCEQSGASTVVTGICAPLCTDLSENAVLNICVQPGKAPVFVEEKRIPVSFAGTGDLFASVLCGHIIHQKSLTDSVRLAASFTTDCVETTLKNGGAEQDGVDFEQNMERLWKL